MAGLTPAKALRTITLGSVVAALMHNRVGYGCDLVEGYVKIAWERVEALRAGALRTRPIDLPVYDPAKPNGGQRRRSPGSTRT